MKSIIESIYNGERNYSDEKIETEEYKEADKNFSEAGDRLVGLLNEEQRKLFGEVEAWSGIMVGAENLKKFKDGFILGFKLAEELLKSP